MQQGPGLRPTPHPKTFGYKKRTMIIFWNVRMLFGNGIGGLQNSRFLQFRLNESKVVVDANLVSDCY